MYQNHLDIKNENDMSNYVRKLKKGYEPLDLSRRCDSVETIKTPSPHNLDYSSPPLTNSPSSHHSPTQYSHHHTPQNSQYPEDYQSTYSCRKRESMSPETYYGKQACNISSDFMLQAALQQRFSLHSPQGESDESSETTSLNKQMLSNYNSRVPMVLGRDGKLARPFKAYPRDPMALNSFSIINAQSAEKFEAFRLKMLKHIRAANGGEACVSNPKMRRVSARAADSESTNNADSESMTNNNNSDSSNSGVKDSAYYERRKKNNAAAKKSRDRRRIKEDEIAIRATYLETENREFQAELQSARNQVAELKIELATVRKQLAMYGVTEIV